MKHTAWTRTSFILREEAETLKVLPDSTYEIIQISTTTLQNNSHMK
jgi:hypothetical protein